MYNQIPLVGLKSVCHRLVSLRLLLLAWSLRFHRNPTDYLCLSLFMPNLRSAPCRTSLYLPDPSHFQPPKTSHPLPVWAVQHSLSKLLLKQYINHFCVLCEWACYLLFLSFVSCTMGHAIHYNCDNIRCSKVTLFIVIIVVYCSFRLLIRELMCHTRWRLECHF